MQPFHTRPDSFNDNSEKSQLFFELSNMRIANQIQLYRNTTTPRCDNQRENSDLTEWLRQREPCYRQLRSSRRA